SVSVGGVQSVSVGGAQSVTVGGIRTVTVTGNEVIHVQSKRTETVDTGEDVTVTGGRGHTVMGNDTLDVKGGNRTVTVSAAHNSTSSTVNVAAATSLTLHHGGDIKGANGDAYLKLETNKATLAAATNVVVETNLASVAVNGGTITLTAADKIEFKCGAATLSLTKDGIVSATGATEVSLGCKSSTLKLEPATASMNGSNVNVTASGKMDLSGAIIKIN
ncbi:MAG: hypothetical protein FWD73_17825, partial [Polyangiaceae bacterium]|nr:hypothetical protein [Polyangiaceae bacterium]